MHSCLISEIDFSLSFPSLRARGLAAARPRYSGGRPTLNCTFSSFTFFVILTPPLSLSLSHLFILSVSFSVTKHEFSREANALARVTHIFRRLAGKSIVSRSECIFDLPRFTRKIFPGRPTSAGRKEGFLVVRANAENARPRLVPFVSLRTVLIGMRGHAFVGATNQPTSQRISARSLALSFSLSPPPLSLSRFLSEDEKRRIYSRALTTTRSSMELCLAAGWACNG